MIEIEGNNPARILNRETPFLGEVLPEVIADHPPWFGSRYTESVEIPRGYKLFETIEYGYRAMFLILRSYETLYGLSRLDSIIARWNRGRRISTREYIRAVANGLGMARNGYIDLRCEESAVRLVRSMIRVEYGFWEEWEVLRRAWGLLKVHA